MRAVFRDHIAAQEGHINPDDGKVGTATPCEGYSIPGHIEQGAWMFLPDDWEHSHEAAGFYCGDQDLEEV